MLISLPNVLNLFQNGKFHIFCLFSWPFLLPYRGVPAYTQSTQLLSLIFEKIKTSFIAKNALKKLASPGLGLQIPKKKSEFVGDHMSSRPRWRFTSLDEHF